MKTIRILAVDDSETFLRGLSSLLALEPDLEMMVTAGSGVEAVEQTRILLPDVVLLDLRLAWEKGDTHRPSQADGLRTIREVLAVHRDASLIVISAFSERRWLVEAMDAGARGYLPKEARGEEILAAIRVVAQGGVALTPEQLAWLRVSANPLTIREKEVLALLAEGKSDAEIARRLSIATATASKHVENIRQKLGASSRGEAVVMARHQGLM